MPQIAVQDAGSHPPAASAVRRAARLAAVALPLALGLWISLHAHFAAWGAEPDVADPVLLWQGVRAHGLSFLASWRYTPDNWLLSVLPAAFVAYAAIGTAPRLAVGAGWLVLVGCIALTALLAARAGGRRAGLTLAAVLLLGSPVALGANGFLSHPVSHGVSLLWGLLALLAMAHGVTTRRCLPLLLGAAALFVAILSDPWALPAFGLPIPAAAALAAAAPHDEAERPALLAGASLAALATAAAATHLFGVLDFLPAAGFRIAATPAMRDNAGMLLRMLSALFDVLPRRNSPCRYAEILNTWSWCERRFGPPEWAALALLLCVTGAALLALLFRWPALDAAARLIVAVASLSPILVVAAYVAGDIPKGPWSGRFLVNLWTFLPLLVAAAYGRRGAGLPGLAAACCGGALALTGITANPAAWLHPGLPLETHGVPALAGFLERHGLAYGYGTYWGARANAVAWLTGGRVVVRPVAFTAAGRIVPQPAQASPLWYEEGDRPSGVNRVFLIVTSDIENCPVRAACLAAAAGQFGPPSERLEYGPYIVLVWPHPLAVRQPP